MPQFRTWKLSDERLKELRVVEFPLDVAQRVEARHLDYEQIWGNMVGSFVPLFVPLCCPLVPLVSPSGPVRS